MATVGELSRTWGLEALTDSGVGKLVDPVADLQRAVGAALGGQNLVKGLVASTESVAEVASGLDAVPSGVVNGGSAAVASTAATAAIVQALDPARVFRNLDPVRPLPPFNQAFGNVLRHQRALTEPVWLAHAGAATAMQWRHGLPTALDAALHALRANPLVTYDTAVRSLSQALELPGNLPEVVRSTAMSIADRVDGSAGWPLPPDLLDAHAATPFPAVKRVGEPGERGLALELLYGLVERTERIEQRQDDLDARLARIEDRLSRPRDALDWYLIIVAHVALAVSAAGINPEVAQALWDELARVARTFHP